MNKCCGCLKLKSKSKKLSSIGGTKIPWTTLNNGKQIPLLGLGTWQATDALELENALEEAFNAGYRHYDTAFFYKNEQVIGTVLKRWIDDQRIQRDDLFVTTKLPPNGMDPSRVPHFLKKSLSNLQLEYVDLYLIHWSWGVPYIDDDTTMPTNAEGLCEADPDTDLVAIWKAMEEQVDAGLAKSIGISNCNSKQIERIIKAARIKPANVQVEISVYCQKKEIRATCAKYDISVSAYSPLGSPGNKEVFAAMGLDFPNWGMLEDPVILEIAEAHKKTAAQICIKFLLQQNIIVIPKSVTPQRIYENCDMFNFELTSEDMTKLSNLDRGDAGRVCFRALKGMEAHPEWPFNNNV